jgi:hypothetical protein
MAGTRQRNLHPMPKAAPLWQALLDYEPDVWHRPEGITSVQLTNLQKWRERGWIQMRRELNGKGSAVYVMRLTLNGRVWTRQWLGEIE